MRKQFATSIDTDISDDFKKACDEYGLKMNTVLEALMKDFSSGNYSITVSKSDISIKKED
jgi:antitoxin component of RelBE/YafQ-DinJ toxin-antitoxin module